MRHTTKKIPVKERLAARKLKAQEEQAKKPQAPIIWLAKDSWLALRCEVRTWIKREFNLKPDEMPRVDGMVVISDGISQATLQSVFTPKSVAEYLGSKSKKWSELWPELVDKATKAVVEDAETKELAGLRRKKASDKLRLGRQIDRLVELEKKYEVKEEE
jgi:hypothetical protein